MLALGINDYIIKPFNADELRIRAYNLLNNYPGQKDFVAQHTEPGDIAIDSNEAGDFKNKVTEFVLKRLKNTEVLVDDLAADLAMSRRQLYRMAQGLTGCTPTKLIKEVRLQKAYDSLTSGNISKLDEVAGQVGFETTAYFSKQFYERFGKKPAEFL